MNNVKKKEEGKQGNKCGKRYNKWGRNRIKECVVERKGTFGEKKERGQENMNGKKYRRM